MKSFNNDLDVEMFSSDEESNAVLSAIFNTSDIPDNNIGSVDDYSFIVSGIDKVGSVVTRIASGSFKLVPKVIDRLTKVVRERITNIRILLIEHDTSELLSLHSAKNVKSDNKLGFRYNEVFGDYSWDFSSYIRPNLNGPTKNSLIDYFTNNIQDMITSRLIKGDKLPFGIDVIPLLITDKKLEVIDTNFEKVYIYKFTTTPKLVKYNNKFIKNQLPLINDTNRLIKNMYSSYDTILEEVKTIKGVENFTKFQVFSKLVDRRLDTLIVLRNIIK